MRRFFFYFLDEVRLIYFILDKLEILCYIIITKRKGKNKMKIAAQTVDVEDIICKVLTKVFPEDLTWDVEIYNEYCTLIEETLICLKEEN